jgi:hypothetical protein
MMPDTICRDSHNPQGCSGGKTALICRNVVMLTRAAERDRSDPRVGTDSVMRMSQHKMVTFVNGNVVAPRMLASLYAFSKTLSRTIQLSHAASESMGRAVGSELMPCQ